MMTKQPKVKQSPISQDELRRIRGRLAERGITQVELSSEIGRNYFTVNQAIRLGIHEPTIRLIQNHIGLN